MSATFDLSSAIKAHRLSLEMSQREYAEQFGLDRYVLQALESNKRYVDKMQLRVLDKLLGALHMTRKMYDSDFGLMNEARAELVWAKSEGVSDRDIADFLGVSSLRTIWDFIDGGSDRSTYHTARTTFALMDEEFRPYIEQCKKRTRPKRKQDEPQEPPPQRDKLIDLARQQGFVAWELEKAEMVGNRLVWMSGTGIYRIELSVNEFKAYYAKTNTLSVYRDLTQKPKDMPARPIMRKTVTIDPIAHYKQSEARYTASDLFRTSFGKE